MNEFEDISFKAVHTGVGFYQDIPTSSYYEDKDEDRLLSSYSMELFHNLDQSSPQFYEQLTERLERPILDSFKKQKKYTTPVKPQIHNTGERKQKKHEVRLLRDEQLSLNSLKLPPWQVMKVDFAFTCGLYLTGWALVGALFNVQTVPSPLLMFFGFCLWHQLYTMICRAMIGCTLGEERSNLTWENGSVLRFILRGFIIILTGFISIPLLSALFKRDLLEDYTQTRLQYNI